MRLGIILSVSATVWAQGATADLKDVAIGDNYVFAPYGHLHGAYQSFDDGRQQTDTIVDPSPSISRFGFFIRPSKSDLGFSFQFESSLGFRPSDKVSQTNTPPAWDWTKGNLRQVQLIHASRFGTLRLGQGSMPLDSAAEVDLGGYNNVAKSNISEGYGSYILRDTTGALTSLDIGDTFDSFDGDRRLRARFDTQSVAGFSLSLAYGIEVLKSGDDNTYYDAALRYKNDFGRLKVTGAIGSGWAKSSASVDRVTVGSIGLLDKETGLNLTVAAGQDAKGTQPNYVYLRAGWNHAFWSVGDTKIALEYFTGSDYGSAGSESQMWGVALLQDFDDLGLQVYAGFREFRYSDLTPVTYLDTQGIQIGARWKF
ncbi:porin [Falsiphaeobacter marinintestinus]|uniref:porin n=1 Tax=Falsiphaeobacter marinintestinus TaxID=1492905 RepID=UPI0011B6C9A1|nr:porin [Phaeobacter marinintestinus]